MSIINRVLCGIKSPLGSIAAVLTIGAQHCWCCSFWRGVLIGCTATMILSLI